MNPPAHDPARPLRRVTAHLIATTPHHTTAITHANGAPALPGARVPFGADPADIARTAAGLPPTTPLTPHDLRTELHHLPGPLHLHIDRLYYTAPAPPTTHPTLPHDHALTLPAHPAPTDLLPDEPPTPHPRLSRIAAYAIATTPDHILLTRISPGFPGAGTWHLPGGGVDHGENARDALARELIEETAQTGVIGDLITFTNHHRPATPTSPEIHSVWAFFHVHIPHPTTPRVTETNGSTCQAAWFPRHALPHPLSSTARRGLTALARP